MTLERHRSKLIPAVTYDLGGRIFVTDGDGTFPLSHGKRRERLPNFKDDNENELVDNSDLQSYRSYDPKRERKYKPRESQFEREVNNINGTLSSGGSKSLQRKLKRHRNSKDETRLDTDGGPKFGTLNLTGTMSDRGRSRRPRDRPPSHPYPGSLNRKKVKQTLNVATLKRNSKLSKEEVYNRSQQVYTYDDGEEEQETLNVKNKKIAEEKLPRFYFLVIGLIMVVLAIVKLLLSWWTAYWAPLWTSALIISLGIIGILHRGDYLTKWKNLAYIIVGSLSLVCALVCCWFLLWVSLPMAAQLGASVPPEVIVKNINQTNAGRSLVGNFPEKSRISLNLGLDIAILVLALLSLYSLTAVQFAMSNHWDAVYDVTGDCDHRGNPRVFNPLEQASLGVVSLVFGLLVMASTQYSKPVYGTPAIAGGLIILAGMLSFAYGKRPDRLALAIISTLAEVIALAACGTAAVFLTLALVSDAKTANYVASTTAVESLAMIKAERGLAIAAITFTGLFFITMIVNVIFASGLLFRVGRKSCCTCMEDNFLLNESKF